MPLLLASADDFHTQQWLRLPAAVQEWEGEGAVRCGAGLSAVHTRSRLLLGTASGLFRLGHGFQERRQDSWVHAQPKMQQAEHLELLLMGCIERIIVCAQSKGAAVDRRFTCYRLSIKMQMLMWREGFANWWIRTDCQLVHGPSISRCWHQPNFLPHLIPLHRALLRLGIIFRVILPRMTHH